MGCAEGLTASLIRQSLLIMLVAGAVVIDWSAALWGGGRVSRLDRGALLA